MLKRIIPILLVIVSCALALTACQPSPDKILLKDAYKDYFSIGAAMGLETMESYTDNEQNLVKHFNSFTAENEMKMASLQGSEGNFNFKNADEQVDFAHQHDMAVRGHALVWYQSAPAWVFAGDNGAQATKEQVLDRVRTHVDTVAKHFADDVYVWDVVNEVIADSGEEQYRTSAIAPYYEICGTDFISEAFIQARKSLDEVGATDVKLYYNDYSMTDPAKRAKTIDMLTMLIEDGVPIDGMGMQSHYNIWNFDVDQFALAIDEFSALGLDVQITELDFDVYPDKTMQAYDVLPEKVDQLLATCYGQVFEVCREKSDVVTNVTMWAVADDYSWLSNAMPSAGMNFARQNFPMLFDIFHERKEAFYAVVDFDGSRYHVDEDDKDPFINYYEGEDDFYINKWQSGVVEDVFTITDEQDGVTKVDYRKQMNLGYPQVMSAVYGDIAHFNYLNITLKSNKENITAMIQMPLIYGVGEEDRHTTFEVNQVLDTEYVTYSIAIPKGARPQLNSSDGVWIFPEPGEASSSVFGTIWIKDTHLSIAVAEGATVINPSTSGSATPLKRYGDTKQWSNEYTWTKYAPTTNKHGEIDISYTGVAEYAPISRLLADYQLTDNKLIIEFDNIKQGDEYSVDEIVFFLRGDKKEWVVPEEGYPYWSYHEYQIGTYLLERDGVGENGKVRLELDISSAEYTLLGNMKDGVSMVMFVESRPPVHGQPRVFDCRGKLSVTKVELAQ